jgi:two-component system response regulator AtoC
MASCDENAEGLIPLQILPNSSSGDDFQFLRDCPAMKALEMATREVANSSLPVLILGESGTGKKALGMRIHRLSPWAGTKLAEIDCSQLRAERLSLTLGCRETMQALPAASDVGTILLLEVSNLDSASQAQLYEFLLGHLGQQGQVERTPKLIFTSNRSLEHEVRVGHFREDLYYQISGICLRIPPLRHRKDDIAILADRFLVQYAALLHRPKPVISESTLRFFSEYSWPGNIRELEDVARTIAAIGDERVAISALRSKQRGARRQNGKAPAVSLKEASRAASRAAEKDLILKVLSRTQWNRKRAAEELKISYKALLYKLKEIGTHGPSPIAERELG